VILRPQSVSAKRFSALQVFFWGGFEAIPLLVRRAARIEKNALYQHQHGNLQVKNPASPKFCAWFFGVRVENSQVLQSRPQCQ